eukprot:m.1168 g.1168  ORF g.1168 m.1168 type:complete len:353 (+) comp5794_c0_seq2:27-1085(+)
MAVEEKSSQCCSCWSWLCRRNQSQRSVTLLFLGIDNAGKSTTLAALQKESKDGITPTVGFAQGNLSMKGCKIKVFDVGGGARIRGIWKNYYAEVHGIVYVVDAFDVGKIKETKVVLGDLVRDPRVEGKPLLLLANKNDLEGSLDEIDICNQLELEETVKKFCPCQVEQCSAIQDGVDKTITKGMQWLLAAIGRDFEALGKRITIDVAEQREMDLKQKRERAERVARYKREREALEENGQTPVEDKKEEEKSTAKMNGEAVAEESTSSSDDVQVGGATLQTKEDARPVPSAGKTSCNGKKKRRKSNKVGVAPNEQIVNSNSLPPLRRPPPWTRGQQEHEHAFLRHTAVDKTAL